jgi:hypothetical protein
VGEPVVDGVREDVLEGLVVLLFGLDLFRPEASPEDVVLPGVTVVEGAGVLAVEVAHPVGEVRERRLDEQVVVVAEQAAGVETPAVAPADPSQDQDEDGPVPVVAEDRLVVIAFRSDVVEGAGGEIATRSSHRREASGGASAETGISVSRRKGGTDVSRARQWTPPQRPRPNGRRAKKGRR